MRKVDLVNKVAERTGISKADVLHTLEISLREIRESLKEGENVYLRGFGSFIVKRRAAKIGRNIKKNTPVSIPEHFIPAFKPAKSFVNRVKSARDKAKTTAK